MNTVDSYKQSVAEVHENRKVGVIMSKRKTIISVILFFTLLLLSVTSALAVSANDTGNSRINLSMSKISPDLLEIMDESDDGQKIGVVLWFRGIDKNNRQEILTSELEKAVQKGILNACDLHNCFIGSPDRAEDLSVQAQRYIEIKRCVEKTLHQEYNRNVISTFSDQIGFDSEIIYVSRYAPFVIANLNKNDICSIADRTEITNIYYFDPTQPEDESVVEDELCISSEDNRLTDEGQGNRSYPYGVWQNITNINVLRDALGYSGAGVKIGLVQNHYPNVFDSVIDSEHQARANELFAYSVTNNLIHNYNIPSANSGGTDHAVYMLSILTGYIVDGYTGIAPMAEVFCDEWSSSSHYYGPIENLVDDGVNVICASITMGNYNSSYDCHAKFLDYIVDYDDVTICISTGNKEAQSNTYEAANGAMSYNAIASGNINDGNTITLNDDICETTSRYSTQANTAFKPDLCAPGCNASTYYHPNIMNLHNGGTSASNAINAGICALLMQVNPALKTNPMLLKSIIMSSAIRLLPMMDDYSNMTNTPPTLMRQYGAGMIDAYQAYSTISNSRYQSYNSSSLSFNYSFTVSPGEVELEKDIYLCMAWTQEITVNGTQYSYETNYYVLNDFLHTMVLKDPNGNPVAQSSYIYDKKQFIRYKPLVSGTYTVTITRTYIDAPEYYPRFSLAYCVK